jgi:hypothetical protein
MQKAKFSKNYTLIVDQGKDSVWSVRIEGPVPINMHVEMLMGLDDARSCSHALAVWHFQQHKIPEQPTEFDKLQWQ